MTGRSTVYRTGYWKRMWERERPTHARAARKVALDDAKWLLAEWADYGDPLLLEQGIDLLRPVETGQ